MAKGDAKRLTVEAVRKISPPKSGRAETYDARVSGLFLRVTSSGHKSWGVDYRFQGKRRRFMIGPWPSVEVDEARIAAESVKRQVREGVDPAAEKRAAKRQADIPETFADTVAEFMKRHASRNKSAKETERIFRVYVLPRWGKRSLDDIRRRDVIQLLDQIADENGVVMADHVLAQVRKLFNWCVERDLLDHTPIVRGMRRSNPRQRQRERWLRDDEIKAVWSAADTLGYPFGTFVKLLLVTGQRREEVSSMRWDEIRGDLWVIPGPKTKNGKEHEVPLSPLAMEIIQGIPKVDDYFFSSGRSRSGKPVSGHSKAKVRLDALIAKSLPEGRGFPHWTFHDLRRTVRTHMSALGISREIAEKVLNHTDSSINAVYDRHAYAPEKRKALEEWGKLMAKHINNKD